MSEKIRILLVSNATDIRDWARKLCEMFDALEWLGDVRSVFEASQRLSVLEPDVILLSMKDMDESILAARQLSVQFPRSSAVILANSPSNALVREIMRAGARDYLDLDQSPQSLVEELVDLIGSERDRYDQLTIQVLSERTTRSARLLTFLSSKGGVGKSTIAVNTAVEFAKRGTKTVLIDLDLRSGVDHLFLGINPERTLGDLVLEVSDIDTMVLKRYVSHHESGLDLLCAPQVMAEATSVTPDLVRLVLQGLLKEYDFVVVDTAPLVDDVLLMAADLAHDNFLVSTMSVNVIQTARTFMELWVKLGYDQGRIKHVINRANVRNGLRMTDVTRLLSNPVFWELDNDELLVDRSINDGQPFVVRHASHRLSKQIATLTDRLMSDYGYRSHRRRGLRRRGS